MVDPYLLKLIEHRLDHMIDILRTMKDKYDRPVFAEIVAKYNINKSDPVILKFLELVKREYLNLKRNFSNDKNDDLLKSILISVYNKKHLQEPKQKSMSIARPAKTFEIGSYDKRHAFEKAKERLDTKLDQPV